MSKKTHHSRRKKSAVMTVCYVIVLALLIGALGYLYLNNREKKAERAEYKESLAKKETDLDFPELTVRETKEEETPEPEPTATPTPEPTATSAPSPTPVEEEAFDPTFLVLNGTKIQGVAAYWKKQLEKEGYSNVAAATYTKTVETETVIYSESVDEEKAEEVFQKLFPNAEFRKESIKDGISFSADQTGQKDSFDFYIVIGTKDARNK
ncbi:LytR C-terminal domain-containing protein [Ruminococcus sp. 5_1_39BFAA]|uniref:LytR C-terminal domain-containing protein n=1 Tax=Ruminococcus sp. 5_1_39BFAA TaxID=457412 RepID=UPI0035646B63